MSDGDVAARARAVFEACLARKLMIATAESCTGGLIAGCITDIAGSSGVFERGFVTYSNEAKQELLGVSGDLLAQDGAVSRSVALAMAHGALAHSRADLAVAVTGIAGPGGGSAEKPVGLVHLAAAARNGRVLHCKQHYGDLGRTMVRDRTVYDALGMLLDLARG